MPETTTREWIQQVLEEHRQLNAKVAELRSFLESPRPELCQPGAHRWSTELCQLLVTLHDLLFRHFREEEEGGMMEELAGRHPRAAPWVDELMGEHREMLRVLRRITSATMSYGEGRMPDDPALRRRLVALCDLLSRHEGQETELIQRLEYEELGLGD